MVDHGGRAAGFLGIPALEPRRVLLGGQLASVVTGILGPHGESLWLEYAVDGVLLIGSLWFLLSTYLMIPEALKAAREGRGAPK